MKTRGTIGILLVLTLLNSSCRTLKQPTVTKQNQIVIKEILRDSTVAIPADRSSFRAVLGRNQTGHAVIKEVLKSNVGKRVQAPKVHLANGFLQVDCITDSANIYLKWKERHITDMFKETVFVPTEKEFSMWQKLQMGLGKVLLIAITGGAIILMLIKRI